VWGLQVDSWQLIAGALSGLLLTLLLFSERPPLIPAQPLAALAPASGEIIALEAVQDARLRRSALKVTIWVGLFNRHRCYNPTEGLIKEYWPRPPEDEALPNRRGPYHCYWVRTDEGDDVLVELFGRGFPAGAAFELQPGERSGQGHLFGYLRFGGRVTCLLPATAVVTVSVGDRVLAGQDLLAEFARPDGRQPEGEQRV